MKIDKKISRFPIPEIDELPEDIKQMVKGAETERGFVPNLLRALGRRPEELRAFMHYAQALEIKGSTLTPAEREIAVVVHSAYNGCQYCVMSHGAGLRELKNDPYISDRIAINYKEADLSPREEAIADFSMKITTDSKSIGEKDFEILKSHGLDTEDIWDLNAYVSFFNFSNRMMNFASVVPDEVNYTKGR